MSPPITAETTQIRNNLQHLRRDLSDREIAVGLSAIVYALRRFKLEDYRIKLALTPFDFHNVPAGIFDLQVGFKPHLTAPPIVVYVRLKAINKDSWS